MTDVPPDNNDDESLLNDDKPRGKRFVRSLTPAQREAIERLAAKTKPIKVDPPKAI